MLEGDDAGTKIFIDRLNTAVTETANEVLGKKLVTKKTVGHIRHTQAV